MADTNVEFTNVKSLRSEALGEPGQRTFRILVDGGEDFAILWLEKEQLFELALAINQLTATLPDVPSAPTAGLEEMAAPREAATLEFKVGKLVLSREGASGKIVIDAHDVESGEDDPPTVRVWGDRAQTKAFSEEAIRVCAAGRPLCPLCNAPMDPKGHKCPRTNGHGLQSLTEA